jgi:hypothetical protein
MNKETLRMQMLAGIITESQYAVRLKETLENDDIIYDNLVNFKHEQLVSDMLSTAEESPSITLINYLQKFDSSKNKLNEILENDDEIYNTLINFKHEQLVSDMLSTAEESPSITLVDYLQGFNYYKNSKKILEKFIDDNFKRFNNLKDDEVISWEHLYFERIIGEFGSEVTEFLENGDFEYKGIFVGWSDEKNDNGDYEIIVGKL